MKLSRVEIEGFRSLRKLVEFDFTDARGVVRLAGQNDDEPSLGANGAGKTSLWEAVFWAIYGRTAQGLKGPEVVSWASKPVREMLKVPMPTIRVLVRIKDCDLVRTWGGKNTLTIDGVDKTQDEVDEFMGLNADQFLYCTYIAQHASTFLDMGAQAKTDLLSSVLGLDYWLDLSKRADKALDRCNADLQAVVFAIGKKEGAIETLIATDYVAQEQEWALRVSNKIAALRKEREDTIALQEKAEAVLKTRKAAIDRAREQLNKTGAVFDKAVEDERAQLRLVKDAEDQIERLKHVLAACDKDNCPTCKQPWPKTLKDRATSVKESIDTVKEKLRPVVIEHRALEQDVASARVKMKEAQSHFATTDEDERESHMTIKGYTQRIADFTRDILAARNEESPFSQLIDDKRRLLKSLGDDVANLKDERALLEAQAQRLAYWVKGFKDVRLFLVTEALLQLEVEVNSAVMQLGLTDWSIRFAPDSETKGGTIKRGFSVMIESPNNDRPVPWAVWSGGEAQRLRLATTFGLSNLISAYTGYQPFVEVFDEASAGLSPEGIKDMLQALQTRSVAEGRQIWVVDHQSLESGVFTETVLAIKAGGTTRLERVSSNQGE